MDDYIIVTVTRGRIDDQYMLDHMEPTCRGLITICCHPGERKAHLKRWGSEVAGVVEYGKNCTNIGEVRNWVMEYGRRLGVKYVIQLDDDVYFGAHTDGYSFGLGYKLLTIRPNFSDREQQNIYVEMFGRMLSGLRRGYGMVGLSARQGNNNATEEERPHTRLRGVYGVSVEKYFAGKERFSDMSNKEDFYMQLTFLTRGIDTLCINTFTFDTTVQNKAGGCSTYRNLDVINRGSELLKEHFPDFVKLVQKKNDNWTNLGGADSRTEVLVSWKKAYEYGVQKYGKKK